MKHILGVDIAKDKLDCCLIGGQQGRLDGQFDNNLRGFKQLGRWLKKAGVEPAELGACMEATGIYGEALLRWLFQTGIVAARVNPAQIKHYARSFLARNKTDRLDAWIIAQFAQERFARGKLRMWRPASADQGRLRMLTRLLCARKDQLAREQRRAKTADSFLHGHVRGMLRAFARQIIEIEKEIAELIAKSPELKRKHDLLRTIPAVGPVTAQIVLSELPEDIENARAAAAYAGLAPERNDSGTRQGQGRMSKTGNPRLRQAMYMPAVSGRKSNPRLKACAERLKKKGLTTKQTIGACMHLLLRLCVGVLASGQPFARQWNARTAN